MATSASKWLIGDRVYDTGVQILRDRGASAFMIDLLSSGPDHFNTTKLINELTKVAELEEPAAPDPDETPAAPVLPGPVTRSPAYDLEKKLKIDRQIRQQMKELAHLHGRLSLTAEGKDLYELAKEIRILDLQKQRLWDQLHYFNNKGEWFDELPENEVKPEDIEQEIKNLMARRSKAKKELKFPLPDEKKEFYQAKIDELTKAIAKLREARTNG